MLMTAILTLQVFVPALRMKSQLVSAIDPSIEAQILNSTVQIRLFAPLPCPQTDDVPANCGGQYVMAQGLGSMVLWDEVKVIVTHNHWGDMLKDAEYVQIHDAQGNLIMKMWMDEFTNLIRYNDPGTLVLNAPAGLAIVPAGLGDDQNVVPGEIVNLVHQDPVNPGRVNVLQARVVTFKEYHGQPVVKLAILDNVMIIPGDSGGGIWLNGELIGNMWASFINTIKLPGSMETSLAAPLPSFYIQAAEVAPVDSQLPCCDLV